MNTQPTGVQYATHEMTTAAFCIQKTPDFSPSKKNVPQIEFGSGAAAQQRGAPRSEQRSPDPLPHLSPRHRREACADSTPPLTARQPDTANVATLLVADDHAMFREALSKLLTAAGFNVVGEAATGREAVEKARCLQPDVVVLDIAMPQLYGIEACHRILAAKPATKVLLLSGYSDDKFIECAAAAGAAGYVVKQNSGVSLVHAIREVVKGKKFFSPSIVRRMAYNSSRSSAGIGRGPASASLTPREREVLQLVAEGTTTKAIAATLDISIKTVEKHRQHLMEKLDLHEIAGLTRYAITSRLIESSVTITFT